MEKILELFVETSDWKSNIESGVKIQDSPDKKMWLDNILRFQSFALSQQVYLVYDGRRQNVYLSD